MRHFRRLTAATLAVTLSIVLSATLLTGCGKKVINPGPQDALRPLAERVDTASNLASAAEDTLTILGGAGKIKPDVEARAHDVVIKFNRGVADFAKRARVFVDNPDPLSRSNLGPLLVELAGFAGDLNATGALGITDPQARAQWQAVINGISFAIASITAIVEAAKGADNGQARAAMARAPATTIELIGALGIVATQFLAAERARADKNAAGIFDAIGGKADAVEARARARIQVLNGS